MLNYVPKYCPSLVLLFLEMTNFGVNYKNAGSAGLFYKKHSVVKFHSRTPDDFCIVVRSTGNICRGA